MYELMTGERVEQDKGLDADSFEYLLLHIVKVTIKLTIESKPI